MQMRSSPFFSSLVDRFCLGQAPNRVFEIVQENTSLRLDLLVFAVEIAQHDDLPLSTKTLARYIYSPPNKDQEEGIEV